MALIDGSAMAVSVSVNGGAGLQAWTAAATLICLPAAVGGYRPRRVSAPRQELVAMAAGPFVVVVLITAFLPSDRPDGSANWLAMSVVCSALAGTGRGAFHVALGTYRSRRSSSRTAIVIGSGRNAGPTIQRLLQHRQARLTFVGQVLAGDTSDGPTSHRPVLGTVTDLAQVLDIGNIEVAVLVCDGLPQQERDVAARLCMAAQRETIGPQTSAAPGAADQTHLRHSRRLQPPANDASAARGVLMVAIRLPAFLTQLRQTPPASPARLAKTAPDLAKPIPQSATARSVELAGPGAPVRPGCPAGCSTDLDVPSPVEAVAARSYAVNSALSPAAVGTAASAAGAAALAWGGVIPVVAYTVVRQAQTFAEWFVGSSLAAGSISRLNHTQEDAQFPMVLSLLVVTVTFPRLARASAGDDSGQAKSRVEADLVIVSALRLVATAYRIGSAHVITSCCPGLDGSLRPTPHVPRRCWRSTALAYGAGHTRRLRVRLLRAGEARAAAGGGSCSRPCRHHRARGCSHRRHRSSRPGHRQRHRHHSGGGPAIGRLAIGRPATGCLAIGRLAYWLDPDLLRAVGGDVAKRPPPQCALAPPPRGPRHSSAPTAPPSRSLSPTSLS
ncbi:hypothetical protein [Actinomadura rudentiformis]